MLVLGGQWTVEWVDTLDKGQIFAKANSLTIKSGSIHWIYDGIFSTEQIIQLINWLFRWMPTSLVNRSSIQWSVMNSWLKMTADFHNSVSLWDCHNNYIWLKPCGKFVLVKSHHNLTEFFKLIITLQSHLPIVQKLIKSNTSDATKFQVDVIIIMYHVQSLTCGVWLVLWRHNEVLLVPCFFFFLSLRFGLNTWIVRQRSASVS